jgi:hypothetical protein
LVCKQREARPSDPLGASGVRPVYIQHPGDRARGGRGEHRSPLRRIGRVYPTRRIARSRLHGPPPAAER